LLAKYWHKMYPIKISKIPRKHNVQMLEDSSDPGFLNFCPHEVNKNINFTNFQKVQRLYSEDGVIIYVKLLMQSKPRYY
jgi:hypothetical protein